MLVSRADIADINTRLERSSQSKTQRRTRISTRLEISAKRSRISLRFLGVAGSTLLFLGNCAFDLVKIELGMRQTYWSICQMLDKQALSRDRALHYARVYADMSQRLYRLADGDLRMAAPRDDFSPFVGFRIFQWCYRKMAAHHEHVGCVAEDIAETIALSISQPFAKLVNQALDEKT